jgi:hypothetical protein
MIRKIETIENEFVEQLQNMLHKSFPEKISFTIQYYIGEDSKGIKGLYIEVISNAFGMVYMKAREMKNWEVVADIEQEFINAVINDLVLAGVSFLQVEAITNQGVVNLEKSVRAKYFRRMMPTVLISMN